MLRTQDVMVHVSYPLTVALRKKVLSVFREVRSGSSITRNFFAKRPTAEMSAPSVGVPNVIMNEWRARWSCPRSVLTV
jgi:hypothetical protein